ncbi:PIN domain-containing protein, partial [Candidatus Bathyarchaeota archaeon]|nr:PIN domain-containing protein [Candidatus Bathyarchaeota archaeon]
MKRLQGSLTLDTSVLVEYLAGSELGEKIREYFANLGPDEKAHCSIYTISELFYIICRL